MIRQLILLFIIIVNPACFFLAMTLLIFRCFGRKKVVVNSMCVWGQMWLRQYVEISNGIRLLKQLRAGLRH